MKQLLLFTIGLLIFLSCQKDPKSELTGCCGNPAIETVIGNSHVYIPNIFTPNDDGRNDVFTAFGDSIRLIVDLVIRDQNGTEVFHDSNFQPHDFDHTWHGTVNGVLKKGLYDYLITIEAENGVIAVREGKVCNFPCGYHNVFDEKIDGTGCQFPAQTDNGRYNSTLPSGEGNDCYE